MTLSKKILTITTNLKFLASLVAIVAFITFILIVMKNQMLIKVEESVDSYMNYIEDIVFMSTYNALKKGNMNTFVKQLKEIGKYKNVKNFSLILKNGEVKYSSDENLVGNTDLKVKSIKKSTTILDKYYINYYFPVLTAQYCTRCHLNWKNGEINSYYKLAFSKKVLSTIHTISNLANWIIFLAGFLIVALLYSVFYYFEGKRFNLIISESEEKYRSIFENMMDVQITCNKNGEITLINPSGLKLLGYDENELIGKPISSTLLHNTDEYIKLIQTLSNNKSIKNYQLMLKKKNNSLVVVEANLSVNKDKNNNILSYEGIFRDITDRKKYEEQLLLSASVFENSIEGIVITDKNGTIKKVNPAFIKLTGFNKEEVIGENPRILKSGRHDKEFYKKMWNSLINKGYWTGEIWNRRKNGEVYPEILSINAIKDPVTGLTNNYVAIFHDISEIKDSEQKLKYQAYHDALTGLPNRLLFNDRLKLAISLTKRNKTKLAILFLDLDNFKYINDTAGHDVGDEFLIEVAKRLKHCSRSEDTVARLGGDEFTIILSNLQNINFAILVAKRILDKLKEPINIGKHTFSASASIGITIYPDDANDIETLLKNADMAMYKAKEQGKSNYQIFTDEVNEIYQNKLSLEIKLRDALKNNKFKLFFQPKLSLSTYKITGVEALVRWQLDDGTFISPNEFILLAEETGLIFPLGHKILRMACEHAKHWISMGYTDIDIAVNLSAKQFQNEKLADIIMQILEDTNLDPTYLQLEVTENVAMKNFEIAIKNMEKLANIGVKFAIDDFGTGYSSLAYLKRFPLSILKIDKTFIDNLPNNENDVAIIKAITSLAKSLNLTVIAEGVENNNQLEFLKINNCDEIQGYLFSYPLPEDEIIKILEKKLFKEFA